MPTILYLKELCTYLFIVIHVKCLCLSLFPLTDNNTVSVVTAVYCTALLLRYCKQYTLSQALRHSAARTGRYKEVSADREAPHLYMTPALHQTVHHLLLLHFVRIPLQLLQLIFAVCFLSNSTEHVLNIFVLLCGVSGLRRCQYCSAVRVARVSGLRGCQGCVGVKVAQVSGLRGCQGCVGVRVAQMSGLRGCHGCAGVRVARVSGLRRCLRARLSILKLWI